MLPAMLGLCHKPYADSEAAPDKPAGIAADKSMRPYFGRIVDGVIVGANWSYTVHISGILPSMQRTSYNAQFI